ncbi:prolyl 3-hydroxylase sud1 [Aphomia sociella]
MSSPSKENEEPSSSTEIVASEGTSNGEKSELSESQRPPAKRRLSSTVIEISDTESDDSDVCAVNSYQASADEVKRIRGADYSSSSSSSVYSSDSESPWEDDSILLEDVEIDKLAIRVQLNPRANRMDDPKLNPSIKSQEVIDRLSTHWQELKDLNSDELTLTCDPFRVCLVHELLANPEIINNIVDDMNTLDWSRKKMDLYEFHQTADLSSLTWQRSIRGIHELLKTEVMSWVSRVTGLELRSMSSSCSLYGPGDHLLVHDDLLADRRVAFILYLSPWRTTPTPTPTSAPERQENGATPDERNHEECKVSTWSAAGGWGAHTGGALELLARDEDGHPSRVTRRIYPANNVLAFFKVGTDSFHQVGEVLSLELPRLSINGWFHGPAPPESAEEPEPPLPPLQLERLHNDVVLLNQWVESTYMTPRSRALIQSQMERESEVCLHEFLLPERYEELLQALSSPDIPWQQCGPAHQRRLSVVPAAWARALPAAHPLRALLSLASSAAFARLLADCTSLALAALERLELQRWRAGDYALLPPRARYLHARLDALLPLGAPRRTRARTAYVAPGDAGAAAALLTLPPRSNALALVYCDAGAASFTAYLSKLAMSPHRCFYVLAATYRE